MSTTRAVNSVDVAVENVGGIDQTTRTLDPGVTILAGKNATNRTSFLRALMGAMGSDAITLKADATAGSVEVNYDGSTFTRELSRNGRTVHLNGDPYLEDPTEADLFAFLLESNECRVAIRHSQELREIVTRPIDTDEIERELRSLQQEQQQLESELSTLDSQVDEQTRLIEQREELEQEIESIEAELEETDAKLDAVEIDIEQARAENEELDTTLTALEQTRSKLSQLKRNRSTETESIAALEEELQAKREALESLSSVDESRLEDLDSQIDRFRSQMDMIDRTVTQLQSVIQFNERFLEAGADDIGLQFTDEGAVTDRLLQDNESIQCWTCGSAIEQQEIADTLDSLRELRREHVDERRSLKDRISELQNERDTLVSERDRLTDLEASIERTEEEVSSRRASLETLDEREAALKDEIVQLEETVASLQREDQEEVFELQAERNRLEYALADKRADLDQLNNRIASIESRINSRDDLVDQIESIKEQITERRTRVSRLQSEAVEAFNEHMELVLDRLGYGNIERIWIEHKGGDEVTDGRFELHIVRRTEDGSVFEDTIDNLSESEREVTGLVFALAGYLAHEVYEDVPFMILDSIEAIDPDRIAELIAYLDGYAEYLVIALLEDDAEVVAEQYSDVTVI